MNQKDLICIVCPKGCHLHAEIGSEIIVTGYGCERGIQYAKNEIISPVRVITSTVKLIGGAYPRLPVKTRDAIPKPLIGDLMEVIHKITITSPVQCGDVIVENILNTGIDLVATRSL